jgi:hypothetical protein
MLVMVVGELILHHLLDGLVAVLVVQTDKVELEMVLVVLLQLVGVVVQVCPHLHLHIQEQVVLAVQE